VRFARVASPVGDLTLVATDVGLREVRWPGEDPPQGAVDAPDDPVLAAAADQLRAWFAGERTAFDLPLDLAAATAFQRRAATPCSRSVSGCGGTPIIFAVR